MQDLGLSFGISLAFKGFKEFAKNTEALKKFSANLDQSTKSVKALNKSIDALEKSKAKISALKEEFGSMSGELVGKAAASLAVVAPVKISANVEDDLNRINQYLNMDNQTLNTLRENFLSLSSSLGAPVNEIMKLGAEASKLGIKSQEQILAFSKLGINYQKVFELSNEEAAGFMSKLSNIYKLNVDQMQSLGDKIVNVAKVSNVSAASVARVMNEVGGDAKLIGMNAEATAALSAAFASATKDEGEAVGTFKVLTGVLSTLNNASDDVKKQFLSLGLSTEQLSAYFKQDGAEAVKILLNQIKTLPKDEMTDFLNSVFGTGAAGMMQNLVDNTDKYEQALKSLNKTQSGSLNQEFHKFNSSTNANIDKLTTSISNLTASLGAALAPAINIITKALSSVINAIRWLVDTFPNLSAAIGTAIVVITALSVAVTAYRTGLILTQLVMANFAFSITKITAAFNILKIAFLSNPIGLVLMVIAAIAALVILNWDKVKNFFIAFLEKISSAFSSFGDFFKGIWQGIGGFFSSLWGGLFGWFASKFEWLSSAFSKIKEVAKSIGAFFGFSEDKNQEENKKQEKITHANSSTPITPKSNITNIIEDKPAMISKKGEFSTRNEINVNINGTFNISSKDGVFDLKNFAKEIENSVLSALNKNADKKAQTTIWG
ncbi:phage tail tape measure protein [Campylobacter lari]|uniref:phage tail tape measure protein n=1 Tax=Campylobacter lari TaxID=201 RepID=UPI0012D0EA60|nr:phage tail tape measure protein [Campylobacter lari]MBT0828861.1 phage tail tape measure protein [Campylobacter lari]